MKKEPPEVVIAYDQYQVIDDKRRECVTSNGIGADNHPEDADEAVLSCLWNTLTARFIEEVGFPVSREAGDRMREAVLQRRTEVVNALMGATKDNPQEIALKKF